VEDPHQKFFQTQIFLRRNKKALFKPQDIIKSLIKIIVPLEQACQKSLLFRGFLSKFLPISEIPSKIPLSSSAAKLLFLKI
jgi:hypothetical protein